MISRRWPQVLLRSSLSRYFSSNDRVLDIVYRTLLEVNATEAFHVSEAQSTAVTMATKGYSVFLHLPTGAGKSLAFQAPALLTETGRTTLVVSPLLALINVREELLYYLWINCYY